MQYDIITKPVFQGLEKVSIDAAKKMSDHHWFNRTLCGVNGKPLSDSNILNRHLHPSLKELGWSDPKTRDGTAGNRAFRKFRNTFLRKSHVPDDLIQFWPGHAGKSMTDDYSQVRGDLKYRKLVAEQVGI